ncbi:MAG: TIGR04086 family membrane protein [Bacillota bacterium]|nr:TIGR04086 family membrane protein [Bacillota bacterium]
MRPVRSLREEETGWALGGVVRGAVVGLLVTVLLLCLLAIVMLWVDIDDRPARVIMDVLGGVGALVAGFVAGQRARARGLVHGAIAGLLFTLVALIIGVLFFGATFALWPWLIRLAVGVVLGALGGIVGVNF